MHYNNAHTLIETARSQAMGKPVANNTRLFRRENNDIAVKFHAVDVVTIHQNGTFTLANGGWNTITTLERIRRFSPAKLFSVKGEWYITLEPREDDPKPEFVSPAIPAPFTQPHPGEEPEGYEGRYDWYKRNRKYNICMSMLDTYGSLEAWREERKIQFAARRDYLKAIREWEIRNRVPFYDGITVDRYGYAPRVRKDGPSPAKLRRHEAEVKRIKASINKYVKGYIAALSEGMKMPGGGDCWYCAMFDTVASNEDAGLTGRLAGRSTAAPIDSGNNDHLFSHMEDKYYVPSLAVNAMRDAGYRDIGIAMWLDMNPDAGIMGGTGRQYDTLKRALTNYLSKRLVPTAPTS